MRIELQPSPACSTPPAPRPNRRTSTWARLCCVGLSLSTACAHARERPVGDFHQHLFGPGTQALSPALERVTAPRLIALLDSAGIRRAAVFSIAYQFSNPNRPRLDDEYARVRAENDWTGEQVALFPGRLRAFCAVNPLSDYALAEIERCAADPRLRTGLKLHFGNSDVQLELPEHVERVRRVFRLANERRMAIVVHMHPSVTRQRPYGAAYARTFLDEILPASPGVAVQIAHMAGAGRLDDPQVDAALAVFARAAADRDPRMRNVWFDVSGLGGLGDSAEVSRRLATSIRQLGVHRVLFGSDGAVGGNSPLATWTALQKLPLTKREFAAIKRNVPPYMR
ncbi:MAG TPA: amidohydrolase family protein [Longimicrobium sp.]|nr:amidohydrolase family protein [Longimicrobium sp.]